MKCDQLETEQWLDYGGEPMPCYPAKDVDEAIAELKAENERLKSERDGVLGLTTSGITLEDLTAIAKKHLNETKRALWLARAKRAIEKIAWFRLWNASISTMNPEDGARQEYDKWKKALGKFLKKAEENK